MNSRIAVDFDYVSTTRISHYTYVIIGLVLHTSVSVRISLYSDTDPYFSKYIDMTIEGDEYRLWGADDSYIAGLISAKVAMLYPKLAVAAEAEVATEVATEVAAEVAAWVNYVTPVEGAYDAAMAIDPELAENQLIFPNADTLSQVKAFKTLDSAEDNEYQAAFQAVVLGA